MEDTTQKQQEGQNVNQPAEKKQETKKGTRRNIGMAAIAYIIFFIPLLTEAKDNPFVKYHVKQGLVLFLFSFIAYLVAIMAPILGWILFPVFKIAIAVLAIIGIINAVNGEQKPLPFIGSFADQFKF